MQSQTRPSPATVKLGGQLFTHALLLHAPTKKRRRKGLNPASGAFSSLTA